jgi:uncharacterized membrane protein (UPF0136 family)
LRLKVKAVMEQCGAMAVSTRERSVALTVLLILEGLGALLVALLNIVTSRALGHDYLPWQSSWVPGAFGVLCLAGAVGITQSASWGTTLAAISQLVVLAAGVYWLVDNRQPVAAIAVALGALGLILVSRTTRRT